MSKFCGNCGAQSDDAAMVCGNCGTPFAAGAAAPADAGNGAADIMEKVKKYIKPAIAAVLAIVILIVGISFVVNHTGVKGAANTYAKAYIKSKPAKMAKVLSVRYGEDTDEKEDEAEDMVIDEDTLEDYKFSYEIKSTKNVSSKELKALKNYFDEEFDMKLKAAKIVKIKITAKDKEDDDKDSNTAKLVFTKEKGGWKYFGYEGELDGFVSRYSEKD